MKELRIKRTKSGKDFTTGVFSLVDEDGKELVTGYTLEPAGPETVMPNLDRRIPADKYSAEWSYSPKFKRFLPLLSNKNVSKSRRILIHTGNYGKDTEGCVIVGSTLGLGAVHNSIAKFRELESFLGRDEFKVVIENAWGQHV